MGTGIIVLGAGPVDLPSLPLFGDFVPLEDWHNQQATSVSNHVLSFVYFYRGKKKNDCLIIEDDSLHMDF